MSDTEYEKFEITDFDLDNEFNINRPVRKLTKKQQIYGIWADDSGDEGSSGVSRPGFKGAGKAKKSYAAPVSFVAGGVQQAGKPKENENKGKNDADDDDEEEDDEDKGHRSSSDSEEEVRVSLGNRRKQLIQNEVIIEGDIAGIRKKRSQINTTLINKGVGSWEKHTKGIGAKLLLQMGYQPGKGLGRELQGISAPVEAHLRKGRGAIGAYGPEKIQKVADIKLDSDVEEAKDFVEKLSQWRKDDPGKKKKIKYVYKSVTEVIQEGKFKPVRKDFSQMSQVKVIDMTGPQQRVLSGYHAIAGQQRPTDEWEIRKDKKFTNFALPELQHNLNVIMDLCEQDIIENDRKLKYTSDQIVSLEHEKENMDKLVEQEEIHINTLQRVLNIVQELIDWSNNKDEPLSLEKAAVAFKDLQEKYYEEYRMYDLSDFATSLVGPMLQEKLASWTPLTNPAEPIDVFKQWKDILEMGDAQTLSSRNTQSPYSKLIWDIWMPSIRAAVLLWNCRISDPLLNLLNVWMPLIPVWIMDNIREQLILSKLQKEVEDWNPMTDTVPIHAWIHPWLPLLSAHLETVIFPTIRNKLSKALLNWHPSDRSAKLMLLPWNNVFSRGEMDTFLIKNIVPKLQIALQEFVINPHEQHLDQWNWVMDWDDLLPVHTMASVLEKHFFTKWLQVLTVWLNHAPNYEEITNWYMGWKNMVPDRLLSQPTIKEQFHKALDLMNRSVGVGNTPGAAESVSYLTNIEQTVPPQRVKERESRYEFLAEAVRTASQIPQGLRELLQKRCEERGILFVPIPNRYREGKPIYQCGKVHVYLDRNVIFVSDNGAMWTPMSLNAVIDKAI